MIRKFKALGLALVAVFAMSAIVASAAQATAGTLTAEGKTVIATAEQVGEHEFVLKDHETEPGKFANTKCKKATFVGTAGVTDGATSVRAHPEYKECTAFGQPATITTTGCDYLLKTGTPNHILHTEPEKTTAATGWHVTTDVVCQTPGPPIVNHVIKIVTGTCEVTVGGQTGLTTSLATNSGGAGAAMDLLLHTEVTGIKYTVVKDAIGCPLKGTGSFSKGDYNGTTTVKAHDSTEETAVGITLH
jgi:hypothetical protein